MVVGDFSIELETVVIGSGPGGYVAAIRAAQMGQKVTVIERDKVGGICLNVGCIPSKALISAAHRYQEALDSEVFGITTTGVSIDFKQTQTWKQHIVDTLTNGVRYLFKKHKITLLQGDAYFTSDTTLRVINETSAQSYEFKQAIIATGSRPVEVKGFKYDARIIDSTGALGLEAIPKRFVVIGGGYIGCELAGVYAALGSHVTILQRSERILRSFEKDMVKLVEKQLEAHGAQIITFAEEMRAQTVEDEVKINYIKDGVPKELIADYVLVSTGRKPNTDNLGLESTHVVLDQLGQVVVDAQCRTSVAHIYAIGDIVAGLPLAHKASYEAKVVAEVITGKDIKVDYQVMPAICFTDPELATAGKTLKEAQAQGIDAKISDFPFSANGRALSLDRSEGFIRLVSDKQSGVILGAQIAGVGASDLIGELVLAMEAGMSAEDIALTVHAHPTLGEAVMDAAELEMGVPIHI